MRTLISGKEGNPGRWAGRIHKHPLEAPTPPIRPIGFIVSLQTGAGELNPDRGEGGRKLGMEERNSGDTEMGLDFSPGRREIVWDGDLQIWENKRGKNVPGIL